MHVKSEIHLKYDIKDRNEIFSGDCLQNNKPILIQCKYLPEKIENVIVCMFSNLEVSYA